MANGFYNRFGYYGFRGQLALQSDTIKCLLLRSTGSYAFNPDHDFVADLFSNGAVEISSASYGRQTLTGGAVNLVDASDRSEAVFDTIDFGALESGQTVAAIVFYKFITNDAASPLLSFHDGKTRVVAAAPVTAPLTGTVTGVTQANPGVVTSAAHGLTNGLKVKLTSIGGMTELNNLVYTVAGVTTNTFQLSGINTTGYGAYTTGGTFKEVKKLYPRAIRDTLLDGSAVDFDGTTGNISGSFNTLSSYIELSDLSGAIAAAADAELQTVVQLPAALGGGSFQITIPADGIYRFFGGLA